MATLISYLPYLVAAGGIWSVINGVLHDIFVLRSEHGKEYNRDLLRLLMDGHVLITCGLVQVFCFDGLERGHSYAYVVALTATVSMLVYCGMIFPFLKSVLTTLINLFLLIILSIGYATINKLINLAL